MSELTKRILVAVPAAVLFLYLTYIGGIVFKVFMGLITLLVIWEMIRMFRKLEITSFPIIVFFLALFVWFHDLPSFAIIAAISAAIILLTTISIFSENTLARRWLLSVFCGVYAPAGFLAVVLIRNSTDGITGFWITIALFLMIWGNDVFAYFGGKNFGKHPLAPSISPNKTWEGFWFGILGAATGLGIVYSLFGDMPFGIVETIPFILIISIFGPLGDLLASRLKRITGVKDSSNLIPGHGGFFDRFDAMILTAPFYYMYLLWIL
ncbi:MAG: phosphatidate cytidylyltransferase [Balneolaceae bacterium]